MGEVDGLGNLVEGTVEEEFLPFTIDDVSGGNLCQNCERMDNCGVLHAINVISVRRDGKKVDDIFGCTPFFKEI